MIVETKWGALFRVTQSTLSTAALSALAITLTIGCLWVGVANATATAEPKDLLIKFANTQTANTFVSHYSSHFALSIQTGGAKIENLGASHWVHARLTDKQLQKLILNDIHRNPNVLAVQPNYKIHLLENYQLKDPVKRARLVALAAKSKLTRNKTAAKDNPDIPFSQMGGSGPDPEFGKQWGMKDIGVTSAWTHAMGNGITVAVIDTGVDYTHEDLIDNLWRNPGETGVDAQGQNKSSNHIDDDGNGYVDDVIGWDFVSNDNKPYDLAAEPIQILIGGGNPGHGTHCAGNVAARANNGRGVAGVAPEAKIMALRFIGEKGEGDTAGAVSAIQYAIKNGAKVLSNSWGSEGEDPAEGTANQALRDVIQEAKNAGVLFVAAAGNGHNGVGYNNDADPKPSVPATYPYENIISVAAIDINNELGSFSNWGPKSVHIAAPGVKVFSTTVGSKYSDTVLDIMGINATWDGTSMACPHVAGAAALYWSNHPTADWQEVKAALIKSAQPLPSLQGKVVSGGKLNVEALVKD